MSDPLIRQGQEKKEDHFTGADFDADFDADEPVKEDATNPWQLASEIDYFAN